MTPTLALAIPHTPWIPERVASMDRLRGALGFRSSDGSGCELGVRTQDGDIYREFTEREANHVWSEKLWTWLSSTDATHCLTLQDDCIVSPGFWSALRAMIKAKPEALICFHSTHPAVMALAQDGERWYTTTDYLVGVGYCLPRAKLAAFLQWRATALKPGAIEAITEDTLMAAWCMAIGERIHHPIPTIIKHDVAIGSTYGNDDHTMRVSPVDWESYEAQHPAVDLGDPRNWESETAPRHLGMQYRGGNVAAVCSEWVEGFGELEHKKAIADTGNRELLRLAYSIRARSDYRPTARVLIATPVRADAVHPAYCRSLISTMSRMEADVVHGFDVFAAEMWEGDLVRIRSRFVRAFLDTDCTHLWFLDADVSVDSDCLIGMLQSGHPIVATPYPKREKRPWKELEGQHRASLHARAYKYQLGFKDGQLKIDGSDCAAIEWAPLGCTLIRRDALEAMVGYYTLKEPEWTFLDKCDGQKRKTQAIFMLKVSADLDLLGEDQSFCARARAIDIPIHVYFGPGSPATHHGDHAYEGHLGAFGLERLT